MERTSRQWGERIKEVRQSAGLSQVELAEKLSISHATMNRIENGKSVPDLLSIVKLSNLLDVNPVWLIFGKEEGKQGIGVAVPVYTEAQLLTGKAKEMTSSQWIRMPGLPENCFLFKTNEQAMAPRIQPGDYVAVIQDDYQSGNIVLFIDKYGAIRVRQLGRQSSGEEFFVAENPSYPPIVRDGDERIFGKITAGIRNYSV